MKVTGYQLNFRLRELQDQREIVSAQFDDSLFQFASEAGMKQSPVELMRVFSECERKIAVLQVAQARYNLAVPVQVLGQAMTLHEAVKRVGGASRAAKMWKDAAKNTGAAAYAYMGQERSRDKEHEYAGRAVSVQEALEHST